MLKNSQFIMPPEYLDYYIVPARGRSTIIPTFKFLKRWDDFCKEIYRAEMETMYQRIPLYFNQYEFYAKLLAEWG